MNDQSQDRTVVLAVVILLGLVGMLGLTGTIWLVHDKIDASAVAVVSTITGTAVGALGTLLASTRSAPPAQIQQAVGYQNALTDVKKFTSGPPPATA